MLSKLGGLLVATLTLSMGLVQAQGGGRGSGLDGFYGATADIPIELYQEPNFGGTNVTKIKKVSVLANNRDCCK